MNPWDFLASVAELSQDYCALNHGDDGTTLEDRKAIECIVVPIGYHKSEIEAVAVRELQIPICQDCYDSILDDVWGLRYCLRCNENAWYIKELSRNSTKEKIVFSKYCGSCMTEEEKRRNEHE